MPIVKISDIVLDPAAQARVALSEEIVCEYADAMKSGDEFPVPHLIFDGFIYYVADGNHRLKAAQLAGFTEIDAIVTEGSFRDAVLIAVGANTSHGLRRTREDRRKAVRMLLADVEWGQWSDVEIARACKVSRELVAKVRSQTGVIPEVVQCNRGGKQFSTRPSRRRRDLHPAETSRMSEEVFDPREIEIEELRSAAESAYRENIQSLHRFDKSRSRESGGSGLGMSIMAGVIAKSGGQLTLRKSELGGLAVVADIPTYRE